MLFRAILLICLFPAKIHSQTRRRAFPEELRYGVWFGKSAKPDHKFLSFRYASASIISVHFTHQQVQYSALSLTK